MHTHTHTYTHTHAHTNIRICAHIHTHIHIHTHTYTHIHTHTHTCTHTHVIIQFQDVQRVVKRIVQDMHSKIGMPEEVKKREQMWRERLSEIEERLNSFQKSRFQPLSSPESSQVNSDVI